MELKYKNPPLVEVVLGVHFKPLPNLGLGKLGSYWHTRRDEWPKCDEAPALEPKYDNYTKMPKIEIVQNIRLSNRIPVRFMLKNSEADRILQIQNGIVMYNWTGYSSTHPSYPKLDLLVSEFILELSKFAAFLELEGKVGLQPNHWELTYVNHIRKGDIWNSPTDWPNLFSSWLSIPSVTNTLRLQNFEMKSEHELVSGQGRIVTQLKSVQVRVPGSEPESVLALTFTGSGPISGTINEMSDIESYWSLGRTGAREVFEALLSESAKKEWSSI